MLASFLGRLRQGSSVKFQCTTADWSPPGDGEGGGGARRGRFAIEAGGVGALPHGLGSGCLQLESVRVASLWYLDLDLEAVVRVEYQEALMATCCEL